MRGLVGVEEGRVDGVEEVVVEGVEGAEDGDERWWFTTIEDILEQTKPVPRAEGAAKCDTIPPASEQLKNCDGERAAQKLRRRLQGRDTFHGLKIRKCVHTCGPPRLILLC